MANDNLIRETTANLKLILPAYGDLADLADLNENFRIIDGLGLIDKDGNVIITADKIRYWNDDPMPAAVGGLKATHTFVDGDKGETLESIFDQLFYPPIPPTIAISGNPAAGVKEVSSTKFDPTFTLTVTAKNRDLTEVYLRQGTTTSNLADIGSNLVGSFNVKTGGSATTKLSASVDVSKPVTKTYQARVKDKEPQTATSSTLTYQWVEPYFYGVVAAAPTTSAQVRGLTKLVQAKGSKTVSFSPTAEKGRFCIAYPKAHGALKSALDWNKFENINDFTQSTVAVQSPDGASTTVDYYVYTYNNIVLPNTGLSMTFSY